MKKIVLTMAAAMAFTFCLAETKSYNTEVRLDMDCNMQSLFTTLDLDEDQMDAVEEIHNGFSDEMQSLATLRGPQLWHGIHQAVRNDARQMRQVLDEKQFKTYMLLLATTLHNRYF